MPREVHKFGSLATLASSATAELWSAGGNHTYPADNATTTLVSASAQDAVGGSGIESGVVQGIVRVGADFHEMTEPFVPLGQSVVTLQNEFWRVYRGWGDEVDSGVVNAGIISIKHGSTVIAEIPAGEGQTLMALYTVPEFENRGMRLTGWHFSVAKGGNAAGVECTLYTRAFGKSWRNRDRAGITSNSVPFSIKWGKGIYLAPGTDVRIRVTGNTANSTAIHGGFWLKG